MRFVVFLLALVAAITALGALFIGMMTVFTDNPHDPKVAWGYVLLGSAAAAIGLSVLAGFVVWARPAGAAVLLWLAAASGLAGMAAQGVIMYLVRNNPNAPDAFNISTAVLASGAVPAAAATFAALAIRYFVMRRRAA